ncbi:MAG: hypothetical protein JST11_04195 [Acidobacteria bacterium]|nr:hypothetical protein [Acidobacteriota bacterium]
MIDVFKAAANLQEFCDRQGWRCCYIGGIAVQRWGEPRVTRDVDLTLLTGFGGEADFVDALLAAYSGRIHGAREFALRNRVLLLQTPDGVGIDISLAALPFEELLIARATAFVVAPGLDIRTCSAEDLIVLKLFAARPLDLRDAESVVIRHGLALDWSHIEELLAPLAEAKGDTEILRHLARLRGIVPR